jgi:hypothetical protein
MNIYLVPYNWTRHVVVAVAAATTALLTWWTLLHVRVWMGPTLYEWGLLYARGAEGPLFLGLTAGAIAFASVLAEHSLRRTGLLWRAAFSLGAALVAFLWTVIGFLILALLVGLFAREPMREIVSDPALASHRHHVWMWIAAGIGAGLGPLIVRRGKGFFAHIGGGIVSAGAAAALWQYLGYHILQDLYLAAAMSVFLWGLLHGLLVWGVPDELYAGWVRVLTPYRYGYRIPVDRVDGAPSERFIGHFPRGLDLFLPVEQGVAELHTSFVRNAHGEYTVRGLSQAATIVKRPLERIDIRYDPSRPAPLETQLQSEDIVIMSDGRNETRLEFVMLPKEER